MIFTDPYDIAKIFMSLRSYLHALFIVKRNFDISNKP